MVIALGWAIILFVLAALRTSGPSQFAASLGIAAGVLSAIATLWAAIYEPRRFSGFPELSARFKSGLVVGLLAADAAVSSGWAGWSLYRANRNIDVLADVRLGGGEKIRPGGHATLDLETITVRRRHLVLTFDIADSNAAIGTCVPSTALSVTAETEGNRRPAVRVLPGAPAEIALASGLRKVHLEITVANERDKNCLIDLRVTRAVLAN
ncbi:hypothetical protein AGRA3207_002768 [Actinomadura graeca]|uniref:Uncharacterized protein n=1 Tax=Actinomadura graeca TaxID=2750812 RepID=A0ABX8QSQ2_9ACTN|nr:hypothetical protein [Actinomadura graeca]QXJ21865.1 hypothetical protein AGRA3207_002768 [Actinomadura graeca]